MSTANDTDDRKPEFSELGDDEIIHVKKIPRLSNKHEYENAPEDSENVKKNQHLMKTTVILPCNI